MPRPPRNVRAGEIYHVVNRGNDCRVIFPQDADYQHFMDLLDRGREHGDVTILGFCGMPTHFHLLLQPETDDALSTYMHWVTGRYAYDRRVNDQTLGQGHVFQRRYWARRMRGEMDFLVALRYVEANALRRGLVDRAQDWMWGSLAERRQESPMLISPCPVALPTEWEAIVNMPQDEFQQMVVRRGVSGRR
jgi:putative transposase